MEAAVLISCIGLAFSLGYFVIDNLGRFLEENLHPFFEGGPRLRAHGPSRVYYKKVS